MLTCDQLDQLIATSLAAVEHHPAHDLPVGRRRPIYHSLGQQRTHEQGGVTVGYLRRVHLALYTVRRVLPIWEAKRPSDQRPQRLLVYSEQIVQGRRFGWQELKNDVLDSFDDDTHEACVGLAATHALAVAQVDNEFNPHVEDLDLEDTDFHAAERDTAYYAAIADAGGPWWVLGSSSARRLSFWQWWLTEAVPAAWKTIADEG